MPKKPTLCAFLQKPKKKLILSKLHKNGNILHCRMKINMLRVSCDEDIDLISILPPIFKFQPFSKSSNYKICPKDAKTV